MYITPVRVRPLRKYARRESFSAASTVGDALLSGTPKSQWYCDITSEINAQWSRRSWRALNRAREGERALRAREY